MDIEDRYYDVVDCIEGYAGYAVGASHEIMMRELPFFFGVDIMDEDVIDYRNRIVEHMSSRYYDFIDNVNNIQYLAIVSKSGLLSKAQISNIIEEVTRKCKKNPFLLEYYAKDTTWYPDLQFMSVAQRNKIKALIKLADLKDTLTDNEKMNKLHKLCEYTYVTPEQVNKFCTTHNIVPTNKCVEQYFKLKSRDIDLGSGVLLGQMISEFIKLGLKPDVETFELCCKTIINQNLTKNEWITTIITNLPKTVTFEELCESMSTIDLRRKRSRSAIIKVLGVLLKHYSDVPTNIPESMIITEPTYVDNIEEADYLSEDDDEELDIDSDEEPEQAKAQKEQIKQKKIICNEARISDTKLILTKGNYPVTAKLCNKICKIGDEILFKCVCDLNKFVITDESFENACSGGSALIIEGLINMKLVPTEACYKYIHNLSSQSLDLLVFSGLKITYETLDNLYEMHGETIKNTDKYGIIGDDNLYFICHRRKIDKYPGVEWTDPNRALFRACFGESLKYLSIGKLEKKEQQKKACKKKYTYDSDTESDEEKKPGKKSKDGEGTDLKLEQLKKIVSESGLKPDQYCYDKALLNNDLSIVDWLETDYKMRPTIITLQLLLSRSQRDSIMNKYANVYKNRYDIICDKLKDVYVINDSTPATKHVNVILNEMYAKPKKVKEVPKKENKENKEKKGKTIVVKPKRKAPAPKKMAKKENAELELD